jgi:hypothetical protein
LAWAFWGQHPKTVTEFPKHSRVRSGAFPLFEKISGLDLAENGGKRPPLEIEKSKSSPVRMQPKAFLSAVSKRPSKTCAILPPCPSKAISVVQVQAKRAASIAVSGGSRVYVPIQR